MLNQLNYEAMVRYEWHVNPQLFVVRYGLCSADQQIIKPPLLLFILNDLFSQRMKQDYN